MQQGRTKTQPQIKDKPDVVPKKEGKLMEWVWDNYNVLISVPATDCNFTAALGYASKDELLRAQFLMEDHPMGNKARLAAVNREIRKRQKGGKF